jgi:predicted protein tyrosine phosphatase
MPKIQNISKAAAKSGSHFFTGDNSILIQIVDPATEFPVPAQKFQEIHQFEFLDVEDDGVTNFGDGRMVDMSEFAITKDQAKQLVQILQSAKERDMNVVVHCHAGICRSGAVVEVGVMMGFDDPKVFRSPNLLVKHEMMRALGWTYDSDEPHTINGQPIAMEWNSFVDKVWFLREARRHHNESQEREGDV